LPEAKYVLGQSKKIIIIKKIKNPYQCFANFFPRRKCKIIFDIARKPYQNSNNTKKQLAKHGKYSRIANCWSTILAMFSVIFGIFCMISKFLFIS